MSNIVEFRRKQAPAAGGFMACNCGPESFLLPVGETIDGNVVVTGLQCPECDAYGPVVNGVFQHDGWSE